MKTKMTNNKKASLLLLALASGAGSLAGVGNACAADSSVQFTGLVDVYIGSLKRSGEAKSVTAVNSSGMSTSWWGFKGTEDLGGGLQAQFNLTSFFRPDVGGAGRSDTDTLFARDANVGLSGSFGKVSLGRDLAPNFVPAVVLNPFGGVGPFSPLMVHTQTPAGAYASQRWVPVVSGDTGWSNEIIYTTPNWHGLVTNLFLQLGEDAGNGSKNNIGANAMYSNGPLTLGAYFQRVRVNNPVDNVSGDSRIFSFIPYNTATGQVYALPASRQQDTWFAGGAYDFRIVKLFATLQFSTNKLPNGIDNNRFDLKSNTAQLGVSAPFSQGVFMLSGARTEVRASSNYLADFGRSDWQSSIVRQTVSFGYDYSLSKRSELYAAVMHDKITGMSGANSVGAGIRHRF